VIETGFFDKLLKRKPKETKYAPTLDGWAPVYGQFGDNIYMSDVVQQAVGCIVKEMKKLNPTHVRYRNEDPVPIRKGGIADVLRQPNPIMTTADFLEKVCWLAELNYNAFIVPVYSTWTGTDANGEKVERRLYEALYPIKPTQVDFIEDASGRLFVQFWFMNGYTTTLPYDDIIHIRYNFSVNDFMGGGYDGQPDHQALLKTLELNKKLLDGVARAMDASYAINGLVKYGTIIGEEATKKAIEDFNRMLQNNASGFIPVDLKSEVVPFQRNTKIVEPETLKFIDEKILRNFGVPLAILSGDYTKEQYEAFYQSALEHRIIAFSQAFTKALFTKRERAFGNCIEFYPKELIFLSVAQTLEMIKELSPTGALFENEKRVALGLRPLEELEGKRYMSLNWVEADKAAQYQLGDNVNVDIVDKEEM
jgi:HK97 family phage portal protein